VAYKYKKPSAYEYRLVVPANAKLSGKIRLAKMSEARAQPTVIFPFERLVIRII